MEYTIVGKFDTRDCDEKLNKSFGSYLYMNCLYKTRVNESIIQLFFDPRPNDAKTLIEIKRIVSEAGNIKEEALIERVLITNS